MAAKRRQKLRLRIYRLGLPSYTDIHQKFPDPKGGVATWVANACGYFINPNIFWTKRIVDKGSYESGFCITDAIPEAAEAIEALMSDLCASQ